MRKYALLLIPVVALLAFWQIYKLYLGYEDLALFYMLQHRAEALAELAKQPNFNIYRHHFWLMPWQFKLFGYNPLPYYVISVLTYIAAGFTLYWFVKKLASEKAALVTAVIFTSGYFGLETIWWSAFNGHQTYLVIILLLLTTGLLVDFTKTKRRSIYLTSLALFTLTIFLFQFRAFLLFFPPLLTLAVFHRPIKQAIYEGLPFIAIFALAMVKAAGVGLTNINHSSTIPLFDGIKALFGNIGASLLPLSLFVPERFTIPIYIAAGLVVTEIIAKFAKRSLAFGWVFGYLLLTSVATAGSVFLGGSPILIYENTVRFVTPIFLGVSIAVGLWYDNMKSRRPARVGVGTPTFASGQKYATAIIGAFVLLNVVLANYYIATRSARHEELRTLYTSIKRELAQLPQKAVFQFAFLKPSVGAFTPGYVVPPDAYLAGIYGKHVSQVKLSRSFDETIKFVKDNQLTENQIFFFNYDRGKIENLSAQLLDILRNSLSPEALAKGDQLSFAPAIAELEIKVQPKSAELGCGIKREFINALVRQREILKDARVRTVAMLDDHRGENLIDGDYDTAWTARDWKEPVFFELQLKEPVAIGSIRWPELPGRRTGRTATVFQLDFGNGKPTNVITMRIQKTLDGRTPQIDELDIFEPGKEPNDYKAFVEFKQQPINCFPDEQTRDQLLESVDNKVTVPIRWLTDGDDRFRPERESKITIFADGKPHRIKVPLNFGPQAARDHIITKIELGQPSLPAEVTASDIKLSYPTLAELLATR